MSAKIVTSLLLMARLLAQVLMLKLFFRLKFVIPYFYISIREEIVKLRIDFGKVK